MRSQLTYIIGLRNTPAFSSFDTNAIAASAMFQLAFPYADGAAESAEMAYLDRKYDTDRANGGYASKPQTPKRGRPKKNPEPEEDSKVLPDGSTGVRLQGTWLPCADAIEIAEEYGLLLYARPLIEAEAIKTANGPVLVGSDAANAAAAGQQAAAKKSPDASARKRQRTSEAAAASSVGDESTSTTASPKSATRTRVKKTAGGEKKTTTTTKIAAAEGMTQKEIDEQIKKSKDLAKEVQAAKAGNAATATATKSRKRRASNERPTAELDHLAGDIDASATFMSRQVRRGGRAVRRRPAVSAAGAVGAAAAAGVGALAWFAGGNIDVAQQLLQQGFQSLSGFFF